MVKRLPTKRLYAIEPSDQEPNPDAAMRGQGKNDHLMDLEDALEGMRMVRGKPVYIKDDRGRLQPVELHMVEYTIVGRVFEPKMLPFNQQLDLAARGLLPDTEPSTLDAPAEPVEAPPSDLEFIARPFTVPQEDS